MIREAGKQRVELVEDVLLDSVDDPADVTVVQAEEHLALQQVTALAVAEQQHRKRNASLHRMP